MLQKLSYVLCGISLISSGVFAQSQIGGATLNGAVTDPSGAAVPNAKVTATQTATGLERTTETSSAGLYNFASLPVGSFDLSVEANGFKRSNVPGIPLGVGAVSTINVRLEVGATQESVSVTSELPAVETTRSQTSTAMDARVVSELPVNGRNFLDFTLLTPGVSRDLTRFGDISFGGQRGTANSLLVDGADSNNIFFGQGTGRAGTGRNPYSFSQDAVAEFQVSTNGYAAEAGRATGGVINVITKSGSNQFHGSLFEFYRDRALNANTWNNNRNARRKGGYHFNQFGGNAGGPMVKNKAFFFFDFDGQRNTTPNIPILALGPVAGDANSLRGYNELSASHLTPYVNSLKNNVYLGKADLNLSGTQRLSVRFNANRFNGVNFENTGAASALSHTGNSDVTTDNLALNYTKVLGASALFDSRFIWTRDNQPGAANSTQPEAQVRQAGINMLSIGRNNFSPRYTNSKTIQLVEALSRQRGSHSYKMGFDFISQRIENFFPGNFGGSFIFNSYADFATRTPASYTQGFAGPNTDGALTRPNANEFAFYVQDSWRVSGRLTLNYGVRYDIFKYAQPQVKNPDAGLASIGLDTSRMNSDTNNWAGRFGFAYKLRDNPRTTTVLRGGYGMFYGRTPSILTGTAFSQNGIQVQTYTLAAGIPAYPNILSAPPTAARTIDIYAFAPDYVQPLTHQWSFNVEQQLGPSYAVTIGYLGVRGVHLSRTRDINLFPAVDTPATFADGSSTTFFRHPNNRPNPNFRRISLFDSGADSIYHGGFVQLSKRFSQSFQLQTSYTFSKVIDSVPDFTSVVVGGGDDAKVAQDTLHPNLDRGRGNSDVRHRFVLAGVWELNYAQSLGHPVARALLGGYQFSPIVNLQSGRFYSPTVGGNSDVQNDGNTRNDRSPFAGRNTFEAPGYAGYDLRFSRDVNLGSERAKLRLIFEAFNLFNRPNFGSINPGVASVITTQYNFNSTTRVFTPNATFRAVNDTFDARILQLAAKITF